LDLTNDYLDTLFFNKLLTQGSSIYGNNFTPRGEFKVLIICVNYDNPNDPNPNNPNWPANSDIPIWLEDNSVVFSDLATFNNIPLGNKSLSRYYYEMSKHLPENERFKLYAEIIPVTIELDYWADSSEYWSGLSERAFEQLEIDNPDIVSILSNCDNRRNNPLYLFDNTPFYQDNSVDYAIIVFRHSAGWDSSEVPVYKMQNWTASHGAYADIRDHIFDSIIIAQGYTHPPGLNGLGKTFLHELAHNIFNAPHYGGTNGVLGSYLFTNTFWGYMPTETNEILACANAWERWYMGYIDIKHDLTNVLQNGIYTLRDYMTYGDAIRIKVPYFDDQYIWLENHQGTNIFDERMDYGSQLCGQTLPDSPTGLMIYIESIADSKSKVGLFKEGANGIKLLNADGNYDYRVIGEGIFFSACHQTPHLKFSTIEENPYNGYNKTSKYLYDKNNNGEIDYWTDGNDGPNDQEFIFWLDGNFIYGNGGVNSAFHEGDKIGIGTNPAIVNMQEYDKNNEKLDPIYLNGISIEVIDEKANGDIDVLIKFNDYNFEQDIKMCGNIILPPENVNLQSNKTIEIDKSGTPNRHTKRNGKYVNPSILSTSGSSSFSLGVNSGLLILSKFMCIMLII
jgi:hypothetical protein